jgi:hypothetical protein
VSRSHGSGRSDLAGGARARPKSTIGLGDRRGAVAHYPRVRLAPVIVSRPELARRRSHLREVEDKDPFCGGSGSRYGQIDDGNKDHERFLSSASSVDR